MSAPTPSRPDPFVRTHEPCGLWLYPLALGAAGILVGVVLAVLLAR